MKYDGYTPQKIRELLVGMRAAYLDGQNVMEFARKIIGGNFNSDVATLIAYDLQAGSYTAQAIEHPELRSLWGKQIANLIMPYIDTTTSLMEVGVGEATTLASVINFLPTKPEIVLGFDVSWSRCKHGQDWLARNKASSDLFVADLFNIPLEDKSIDVIYTSHSVEPNGGREEDALRELLRVANRALVLVEPIYELASSEAKIRMDHHGYVKNLKGVAESLGYRIFNYKLLDFSFNLLNPSGVLLILKDNPISQTSIGWRCPLTHSPLIKNVDSFFSAEAGLAYPIFQGIPMLTSDNAIVASSYLRK